MAMSLDEFKSYSSIYNLASRLGFKTAKDAWTANPWIQFSTDPRDFKRISPTGNETIRTGDALPTGKYSRIRCYDNGGKTFDRYTVIYMDEQERTNSNLFDCVGMSSNPFAPQGFGQHSSAMPGKHLGKRIAFTELPADCQKVVLQDLR